MRHAVAAFAVLMPASLFATSGVRGAELQQPVPLDTPGLSVGVSPGAANPPGSVATCPALPQPFGSIRPGQVVVRDADRPDVGPYTVRLPGYSLGTSPGDPQFYRPFLITASPGDSFRFDMVNQLNAGAPSTGEPTSYISLHTHGLVVSPRPCTPLGDYIFVEDQPGTTTSYRIDIPPTLPGNMFSNLPAPRTYPSGLSWFHSHLHGQVQDDLMAGQSGILYVGDLRADLLAAPNPDPATQDMLNNTDTLYLGLRDIQLAVPAGANPDAAAPGQRATWLHGGDYNTSACLAYANPPIPVPGQFAGEGYCGHHGASQGGKASAQQDTVWMFTVNGQRNPTITMQPGRSQIWRIVNTSPDVTYVLQLTDDATGQPQTLTSLAFDGVTAGSNATGSNDLQVGLPQQSLLLTPANRVELLVANQGGAAGRTLTLRTIGLTTGSGGDSWPRIDLAHVVMPPGAATAAPFNVVLPGLAPSPAAPTTASASAAVPVNCTTLPPGRKAHRRITFTNAPDGSAFYLQSEVVDAYGRVVDPKLTIPAQEFPMQAMISPDSVPHICPRLGEQEVWEVLNASGVLHNFHIHQNKFRLTRPGDSGAPFYLTGFQDPTNMVAPYIPEVQDAKAGATVDVWRDVIGLPPYGGRIFVTIPFYAPSQVGNFVYHCHILRHEDLGMMAVVQIFNPQQVASNDDPDQFASVLKQSICGAPPASPQGPATLASWIQDATRSSFRSALRSLR